MFKTTDIEQSRHTRPNESLANLKTDFTKVRNPNSPKWRFLKTKPQARPSFSGQHIK